MRTGKSGKLKMELYAFVVALIMVFAYALFQIVIPHTPTVDTTELVTAQSVTSVSGCGCIVRDETLLQTTAQGMIYALVNDGEKVAANSEIYCVYPNVDADQYDSVRERLRLVDDVLADLYNVSGSSTLATLPALREDVYRAYAAYVEQAQAGNLSALPALQKQWLTLLNRMKKLTAGSTYTQQIEIIEQAKQELLATYGTGVIGYSLADRSGYYWSASACDGYESVLTPALLETMTAAQLQDVLTAGKMQIGSDCAGKMVLNAVWYLALPLPADQASVLTVGKSYTVTLTEEDLTLPMTLERVNLSEGEALAVFSCSRHPEDFSFGRLQNVSVTVSSKTGYRIPVDAVAYYHDEWGVFILRGGTVHFRRIAAVATGTDFVLAAVSDPQPEKATTYLAATDMLIIYGKNLYDGKVVS